MNSRRASAILAFSSSPTQVVVKAMLRGSFWVFAVQPAATVLVRATLVKYVLQSLRALMIIRN